MSDEWVTVGRSFADLAFVDIDTVDTGTRRRPRRRATCPYCGEYGHHHDPTCPLEDPDER